MTKSSLSDAIKTPSEKDLTQKLDKAFERLSQTAAGRETLSYLKDLGYSVVFEPSLASVNGMGCKGLCMWNKKVIALNPHVAPEEIPSIVVHETQHAVQGNIYPEGMDITDVQMGDMFKFRRSIEADACAHQAAYAYEINAAGGKEEMPGVYGSLLTVYSAVMDQTQDKKQAMNAAFKEWYNVETSMDFYDKYYTNAICDSVVDDLIQEKQSGCFMNKKTDREYANIILFEGKPYVEPEFFSSPQAFNLKSSEKKRLMTAMQKYSKATGTPLDTSVLGMSDRKKAEPVKTAEKKGNTAIAAAIKQKGRAY